MNRVGREKRLGGVVRACAGILALGNVFLYAGVADAQVITVPITVVVTPRGACARLFFPDTQLGLGSPNDRVMLQRNSFQSRVVCRFDAKVFPALPGRVRIEAPGSSRDVQDISGQGSFSFSRSFPRRSLLAASPYTVKVSFHSSGTPVTDRMVSPLLPLPEKTSVCFDAVKVVQDEEVRQRSCQRDSDCSVATIPFGCGCQYAKPVRKGGDPKGFFSLAEQSRAAGCAINDITPCDCAEIRGVVCNRGLCDWRVG